MEKVLVRCTIMLTVVISVLIIFIIIFSCNVIADDKDADDHNNMSVKANKLSLSEHIIAPIAEFNDKEFEFLPVKEGTKIIHDFIVKNRGKATLLIKTVKTD